MRTYIRVEGLVGTFVQLGRMVRADKTLYLFQHTKMVRLTPCRRCSCQTWLVNARARHDLSPMGVGLLLVCNICYYLYVNCYISNLSGNCMLLIKFDYGLWGGEYLLIIAQSLMFPFLFAAWFFSESFK